MTNNVIAFPKKSRIHPPQNEEEFKLGITKQKSEYANEIIDHYAQQLVNKMGMHGFMVNDEQFMKDFAFTVETMRSCLHRSLGVHHPFQQMIDEAIDDLGVDEVNAAFSDDEEETNPEDDLI